MSTSFPSPSTETARGTLLPDRAFGDGAGRRLFLGKDSISSITSVFNPPTEAFSQGNSYLYFFKVGFFSHEFLHLSTF